MSNLCSPRLQFTRDARRVVCATSTGLAIHEAGSHERLAIASAHRVRSLAAFADEVWATNATELVRWDLRGRSIGRPIAIDGHAGLVPALAGPAAATLADHLWFGGGQGEAALSQIACGADVLPFVGKKTIEVTRYRGERVARLGAAAWRLGAAQLVAAAPLFEGSGVVLFVRTAGRAEAWSSTLTGAIHHVVELPDGEVRLAARAGIAVVQTAPDRVVAFDLRYGRRIGDGALPGPADDLAIDPDGKYLAHTDADGELVITTLHDAIKIATHNTHARGITNDDHGDDDNDPELDEMSDVEEAVDATDEGTDTGAGVATGGPEIEAAEVGEVAVDLELAAASSGTLQLGDAIAPAVVFGDIKPEPVPDDEVFHASTGAVDWVAAGGTYANGRF